jgi:hypothetical protein
MGKSIIEVVSRSYGSLSVTVNRGPQFTHEVAQYSSYLLLSLKSRRQSSQIAMSGDVKPNSPSPLAAMVKSL